MEVVERISNIGKVPTVGSLRGIRENATDQEGQESIKIDALVQHNWPSEHIIQSMRSIKTGRDHPFYLSRIMPSLEDLDRTIRDNQIQSIKNESIDEIDSLILQMEKRRSLGKTCSEEESDMKSQKNSSKEQSKVDINVNTKKLDRKETLELGDFWKDFKEGKLKGSPKEFEESHLNFFFEGLMDFSKKKSLAPSSEIPILEKKESATSESKSQKEEHKSIVSTSVVKNPLILEAEQIEAQYEKVSFRNLSSSKKHNPKAHKSQRQIPTINYLSHSPKKARHRSQNSKSFSKHLQKASQNLSQTEPPVEPPLNQSKQQGLCLPRMDNPVYTVSMHHRAIPLIFHREWGTSGLYERLYQGAGFKRSQEFTKTPSNSPKHGIKKLTIQPHTKSQKIVPPLTLSNISPQGKKVTKPYKQFSASKEVPNTSADKHRLPSQRNTERKGRLGFSEVKRAKNSSQEPASRKRRSLRVGKENPPQICLQEEESTFMRSTREYGLAETPGGNKNLREGRKSSKIWSLPSSTPKYGCLTDRRSRRQTPLKQFISKTTELLHVDFKEDDPYDSNSISKKNVKRKELSKILNNREKFESQANLKFKSLRGYDQNRSLNSLKAWTESTLVNTGMNSQRVSQKSQNNWKHIG